MKMGGQLRVVAGLGGLRMLGYDFVAAFALGDALGFDRLAIAEFLPDVESVAREKLNAQWEDPDGSREDG